MRGNRYARGGDPTLTRSERRKERARRVATSKRSIRLRRRLGRLASKNFAHQEDSHMTALMESYILRRKEARKKERQAQQAVVNEGTGESKDVCRDAAQHARRTVIPPSRADNNTSPQSKRPQPREQGRGGGSGRRSEGSNRDSRREPRVKTRSLY